MEKNKIHSQNSGQAILELLIMLIAFASCMLGVIFVCGLSIGNIELLLNARTNADLSAHGESTGNAGSEISNWRYTTIKDSQGNRHDVPFLLNDRAYNQGDNLALFNQEINNKDYSASNDPNNSSNYIFGSFNSFEPLTNVNFATLTPIKGSLAAALHKGTGNIKNTVITIDKSNISNHEKLFEAMEILSSSTIDTDKIRHAISNQVYMPALKIKE